MIANMPAYVKSSNGVLTITLGDGQSRSYNKKQLDDIMNEFEVAFDRGEQWSGNVEDSQFDYVLLQLYAEVKKLSFDDKTK